MPPAANNSPQRTILIVEDDFLIAMNLADVFSAAGWVVIGPALNIPEALEMVASHTPNVALLDVNLKGEVVTPVAEALRERHIPFVLSSAYDRPDRVAAPLNGARSVEKPVNPQRVLAVLDEVVRGGGS
jgi:DNA-binding response OmpR family regulator